MINMFAAVQFAISLILLGFCIFCCIRLYKLTRTLEEIGFENTKTDFRLYVLEKKQNIYFEKNAS